MFEGVQQVLRGAYVQVILVGSNFDRQGTV